MFMRLHETLKRSLVLTGFLLVTAAAPATDNPRGRAERVYREAHTTLETEPKSVEALWKLARACFDWAEVAPPENRASIAEEGIAAAQQGIGRKYGSAAAHYYLAMNLGQLARTKSLGALKLVREMEQEFKEAISLDEKFDHAGPHRSLGLLYKDAPGWPTSIGSRSKARQHLGRACELAPEYPDNRLSLEEAYLEWGEPKTIASDLPGMEEFMKEARKKFTGEQWEASWRDWEARYARLKVKAAKPSDPATTPRGRGK